MMAFGAARCGNTMEIRYLNDGTPVGNVSLAFRLGIKDSAGEYKTQWISASLFGKRAESLAPYLTKGSLHAFHLRDVHTEEYMHRDNTKRVIMKATISDVELCGEKSTRTNPDTTVQPDDIPF